MTLVKPAPGPAPPRLSRLTSQPATKTGKARPKNREICRVHVASRADPIKGLIESHGHDRQIGQAKKLTRPGGEHRHPVLVRDPSGPPKSQPAPARSDNTTLVRREGPMTKMVPVTFPWHRTALTDRHSGQPLMTGPKT